MSIRDWTPQDAADQDAKPPAPDCPNCGSDDTDRFHRDGDMLAPECDYNSCNECEHEWGHT